MIKGRSLKGLTVSFLSALMLYISIPAMAGSNAGYLVKQGLHAAGNGDYTTAAKLFKKACDGGIAEGCINLGVLYYNGQGVYMNKFKAYKYLIKAAKHVNQDAQHDMVILCRQSPWACK